METSTGTAEGRGVRSAYIDQPPLSFEEYLTSADSRGNLRRHFVRATLRVVALMALDAIALGVCILGLSTFGPIWGGVEGGVAVDPLTWGPFFGGIVIGMLAVGAYRAGDRWSDPIRIMGATGIGVLLLSYSALWTEFPIQALGRGVVTWVILGVGLVVLRTGLREVVSRLMSPRLRHRVLEIRGVGADSTDLADLGSRFETTGVLRATELPADIEEMEHWLVGGVDTLAVSGHLSPADFGRLTDFALAHGCRLLAAPRAFELRGVFPQRVWLEGRAFTDLTTPSLRASQMLVKRALDVVGATALLVLTSPIFAIVAAAVWFDSPGPVFFRQRRAGYRGRFFWVFKFRSMRMDAEEILKSNPEMHRIYIDNNFKLPEDKDPRITRLGRFLRKTSLDELPQLLNVLKGDMSLVGPRPVVQAELEMYRGRIPTFLSVKPGVTGPWQVSGRSHIGFPERAELDLAYVRGWSLLRDLWILAMTLPAVLLQRGAH